MLKLDIRVPVLLGLTCVFGVNVEAQVASAQAWNNPYSPSPDGRAKTVEISAVVTPPAIAMVKTAVETPKRRIESQPIIEPKLPTETYKVGVGDVLLIEVKNVSQGEGYCTVRESGTVDLPLAGGEIIVADKTAAAVAREIASRITLFADPQVEVSVREYGSHKVTVAGLVDRPGERSLQREAIPLFVIMAEAGVHPTAGEAVITRAPLLKPETYSLTDNSADGVLVYPGNAIEFTAGPPSRGVYFVVGSVAAPGQKELVPGQTLYQAVAAAGGIKGSAKKGLIRRRDEKGVFTVTEFNLRSIRDGKAVDPPLAAGDVVEIVN